MTDGKKFLVAGGIWIGICILFSVSIVGQLTVTEKKEKEVVPVKHTPEAKLAPAKWKAALGKCYWRAEWTGAAPHIESYHRLELTNPYTDDDYWAAWGHTLVNCLTSEGVRKELALKERDQHIKKIKDLYD